MATVQLAVEQVNFEEGTRSHHEHSVKSFDSVVDPFTDFPTDSCQHIDESSAISQDIYSSHQFTMSSDADINRKKTNHTRKSRKLSYSSRPDWKLTPGNSPTPPEAQESENDDKAILKEDQNKLTNGKASKMIDDDEDILYCYGYHAAVVNYPYISNSVAQYLNEHNPELSAKALEAYHKEINLSPPSLQDDNDSKEFKEIFFPSPFKAMTNTSEALALQQSVIGNASIKPVSPEVVAKIVASTKARLNQSISSPSVSDDCAMMTEKSSKKFSFNFENEKQIPIKGESQQKIPDGVIFNELIRYPREAITTTFEKKVGFFNSSSSSGAENPSSSSVSSTPKKSLCKSAEATFSRSRHSSQSSIGSIESRKGAKIEMAGTHIGRKHVPEELLDRLEKERIGQTSEVTNFSENLLKEPNTKNNIVKFDSDKGDLNSVCSESFETESNFSSVTGIEEEMFCIKKLLIDVPSSHLKFSSGNRDKNSSFDGIQQLEQQPLAVERQSSQLQDKATETDNLEYFEILCQNANFQGQIHTLRSEIESFMKDKMQLKELVATLESRLKVELEEKEVLNKENLELMAEFERISKEHRGWSNVISEYQNVIDSKIAEIKGLKEDLSESQISKAKLKVNLEETKVDIESKDVAVEGLKKKIAELHVEVLTLLQIKVQLENDINSVKGEMETLRKSKEWYQQQLSSVHENRNNIHQDLIKTQAEKVLCNKILEEMKTENKHLRQQLTETQQKAVKEKEILMKHLETIEMDMLERESLFQQIQKDRGAAEESLTIRMKKLEEEQSNLNNLNFTISDLEHQLSVARNDITSKEEMIKKCERDQADLLKQLVFYEKTINEKDLSSQWLEQQLKDSDQKLKLAELKLSSLEEHIITLKGEKTAVEIALAAANEEKKAVNETLWNLKDNLNCVEGTFKQMRTELVAKASLVEQLQKEKNHIEDSLQKAEAKLLHQKQEFEFKSTNENKNAEIMLQDVQCQKNELETVLEATRKELLQVQKSSSMLTEERDDLKKQVSEITKLSHSSEKTVSFLKDQNCQFTAVIGNFKGGQDDINTYSYITKAKHGVPDPTMNVEETCKMKHQQLSELLETTEKEFEKRQRMYESNIKLLTRKLKESMKAKKKIEQNLQQIQVSTAETEQQTEDDLYEQFLANQNLRNKKNEQLKFECDSMQLEKHKKRIDYLEEELNVLHRKAEESRLTAKQRQEFILKLEKDKGQLAESLGTTKQHVTGLEAQLLEKQSELTELSHQLKTVELSYKEDAVKNKDKLCTLEQELTKEKTVTKELRRQIFQDKRENSQLKRNMTSLKSNLAQANQIADSRRLEVLTLQSELNVKHQAELKHRAEMETLQTDYKKTQAEVKQLKQEMEEHAARDPAVADQMKTLSWHLKEKTQELAAIKEQLCVAETSHKGELESLNQQLKHVQKETEDLKVELSNTRKEKFSYQTKLTELRSALKSTMDRNKELQNQLLMCKIGSSENDQAKDASILDIAPPASPLPYDDTFITTLLQQSAVLPESRPLSNLQTCLNALKKEMAVLQKQLEDQTETVAGS